MAHVTAFPAVVQCVDSVYSVLVHVRLVELAMVGSAAVKSGALEAVAPVDNQLEAPEAAAQLNLVGILVLVTADLADMETEKLVAVALVDMEIGLGAVA